MMIHIGESICMYILGHYLLNQLCPFPFLCMKVSKVIKIRTVLSMTSRKAVKVAAAADRCYKEKTGQLSKQN